MITRESMIQPMLAASPEFEPTWRAFLAEWNEDPHGPPIYLLLSDLARHISQLVDRGESTTLRLVFDVIESWHTDGDPYVKEAASVGLLEDLQNTNLVAKSAQAACIKLLGPESLKSWQQVEEFWKRVGAAQ